MLPRFHAPTLDPDQPLASIAGDEARHLTKVMRLGPGSEVAVFDGRGREFRARVLSTAPGTVSVELLEPIQAAPEPAVRLTLVQAVLKGDRMDDVVRDATMMGVAEIVPVVSAHLAVKAEALERGKPAERWRRVALSSAKQCRRATLPVVHDPRPFRDWLSSDDQAARLLFIEPSTGAGGQSLREWLNRPAPRSAAVIVGPEGGWATEEIETAVQSGCVPVTLGGLTLRADAVPMVALSVCRFVFEG
jgi:16S rRNA (uracil1498-N3)-methyltransferase